MRTSTLVGRSLVACAAAATLLTAGLAAPAGAATRPSFVCDTIEAPEGGLSERTVYGDLRVSAGHTCLLEQVTVTGDVVVEPGGTLDALSSTFRRDVVVSSATAWVTASTVAGSVVTTGTADVFVSRTGVTHDVRGTAARVTLDSATVNGLVNVTVTDRLGLLQAQVAGRVVSRGGAVRIDTSTLGSLTARRAASFQVCGTDVEGDVAVTGGLGVTAIGLSEDESCFFGLERVSVSIGGSLLLADNGDRVTLRETSVSGDLGCTGNALLEVDPAVEVGGQRTGQCAGTGGLPDEPTS